MKRLIILAALLGAACAKEPAADPGKAESYAVRLAVTPSAGAPEQRIALPAAALAALQSRGFADLRLFDADGRALPLALSASPASAQQTGVDVPVYPVIGTAAPSTAGVALTIGADNVARVVGVAGAQTAEGRPVAALLDTRKIADPVVAVVLDAELPLQQPVTVTLESSADLARWEPLGEKVLFRTDAAGAQLDAGRIALGGASLNQRYLRASWGAAKGVSVRSAQVISAKTGQPSRIAIAASGASLTDSREVTFDLPVSGALAAVRIDPAGNEGVLPVVLAGRAGAEGPWNPLAAATLRAVGANGNVIELGAGSALRQFRVTADPRTPGFAAPPKVELLFEPAELVTRFNGKPPYTLAAGLDGAPATLLSLTDIAPDGAVQGLALAQVAPGQPPVVSLAAAETAGLPGKNIALWLVLLAGVAVLGFAVVRLMRGATAA